MTEKKGSEKREFCSFRFQIRARFVFAIIVGCLPKEAADHSISFFSI